MNLRMNLEWIWDAVKLFMCLVERPGDGEKKKIEVMELIDELYDDFDIDIPKDTFDSIISAAIDYLALVLF
ncbi:MAG TPA: hypothetical protein PKI14_07695 [Fervidobacterium sp.]|nr:hypothetical protein [Fervidobacterium sp.]HOM74309.1 hypothetical protein [Fervidobacterium sp.]HOQ39894.1 hypothetical protein [Fervidobacterium sp.]HPP17996.1 hypothetical protein [Fervidobacterium sp.]HPT54708.1 hypothetical protein [Fervidobacterium sp.]